MSLSEPQQQWHGMPVQAVADHWATDLRAGLSPQEVDQRREKHGSNAIREAKARGPFSILAAQFADFMIGVLLAAAILAGVLGEIEDTIAIGVIVILNALIGFVQEYRAEKAMAMLRQLAAHQARVLRGGNVITVPAMELVPGDIVLMEAGNQVPADLRVDESAQLRINESALTGESVPAEKRTDAVEAQALGDRHSMAFKGTHVTAGRGRGIVVATGMETELGRIAELLEQRVDTQTPLQKRLAHFGRNLAFVALGICAIVFAAGLAQGQPWVEMLLTSVSLAVAAIPEALPAVVTVTLALGARRMLKANTLVRRLPAVETLGSVTFICSDKTGTLTENRMRVTETQPQGEANSLLRAMALNNDASRQPDGALTGDPTETALLEAAEQAGQKKAEIEQQWPRVFEFPFDSERKRMTTIHKTPEGLVALLKGAPEAVLPCCTAPPGDALDRSNRLAAQGRRVLAFAQRRVEGDPAQLKIEQVEADCEFLGLVAMIDPPRAEAKDAVAQCMAAGIAPVMITGDHPATAKAIAAELGIAQGDAPVLTGADLTGLSPEQFAERVRDVRVYARVDPAQKLRIVEALQKHGEYVAMTGDGVNDAPALQRSDIGIAMGKAGTDVAREAADLVLMDDNFATIVGAVREGRHIFDNIRKFVRFIMASNSAEIWTILLAPLMGLPVPLLPIHILWTNLVTDGLPALALAVEPASRDLMQRPPRPPTESLFAHGLWQHTLWVGLLIAGLSIFSQAFAIHEHSDHWRTIVFTVLTLSQMAHVLAVRSERESLFSIGVFSNLPLAGAVALTVALQMMVIYVPMFQQVFKTAALTAGELAEVALLCSVVFGAVELEKWLVRHRGLYK